MSRAPVAVCTVTHDSAADLPAYFAALATLNPGPQEVIVVDSGSHDDSLALLERSQRGQLEAAQLVVLAQEDNLGFAAAMNRAVGCCSSPYLLSLNPDARPDPDFLEHLCSAAEQRPGLRLGAVTGRVRRPDGRLDACGMRLVPSWRHFDRGSEEPDRGQYRHAARVFGATGAASLWVRAALEDVAIEGEIFDPRFHTFREDAELCFRLQERGWQVLYEPRAGCEHRRSSTPGRRAAMPPRVNLHSLKNRYLLRAYHETAASLLATLPFAGVRELLILLFVLARERTSLGAYGWLIAHRAEILRRRRLIQDRRTVSALELARWFWRTEVPW